MKFFIVLTIFLGVTIVSTHQSLYPVSQDNIRYDGRYGYAYPQIGPDGVPIDTPEVQQARANHLAVVARARAAHAEWAARYGLISRDCGGSNVNGQDSSVKNDGQNGYVYPKNGKDGASQDASNVQQAKSDHSAAVSNAKASNAGWSGYNSLDGSLYGKQSGGSNLYGNPQVMKYDGRYGYAYPEIDQTGVPIDTPEVRQARVAHLNVVSLARAAHKDWAPQENQHYRHRRSVKENPESIIVGDRHINPEAFTYPDLDQDGRPIDTPAVQALKQAHFAAYTAALARIEQERKINGWKENDSLNDNGAWKDDTWNKGWEVNYNVLNTNVKDNSNKGFIDNVLKHLEPITLYNNPIEPDRLQKITRKNDDWLNEGFNNNDWINKGYNNISWNNKGYNNISWKNTEPVISTFNHQQHESLPHTKITLNNNSISWNNEEHSTWNNLSNIWNNNSRKVKLYNGPTHVPKIGPNGVPEDTPEVQRARQEHLAALEAAAKAASYKKTHEAERPHHH